MRKIAILQSNYLPWIGNFDLIRSVDQYVILDHVQYTQRGWRNRNKLKTPEGIQWLTIPLGSQHGLPINQVKLPSTDWKELHWKTIAANYSRAEHFKHLGPELKSVLFQKTDFLYELNFNLISFACEILDIKTPIISSSELDIDYSDLRKSELLIEICKNLNADSYVSGPAGQVYLEENVFLDSGIDLEYFSYPTYPEYQQLWGDFVPNLSIIDPILNLGENSKYLTGSKCVSAKELAHAG